MSILIVRSHFDGNVCCCRNSCLHLAFLLREGGLNFFNPTRGGWHTPSGETVHCLCQTSISKILGRKNVQPKLRDQIIWLKFHCCCQTNISSQNFKKNLSLSSPPFPFKPSLVFVETVLQSSPLDNSN